MKNIILTIVISMAFQLLEAQPSGQVQTPRSYIPSTIPPSPNASAIEKFGTIPVDYSTGVPQIGYPFWTWKRGKMTYNCGLTYHAGGNKTEDMASNVGLGWAFNGGGRISRTVKGLIDDKAKYGYMYVNHYGVGIDPASFPNTIFYGHTYNFNGDLFIVAPYPSGTVVNGEVYIEDPTKVITTDNNSPATPEILDIANNQIDGEQDLFSLSINGISCRFVIDKDKTIRPLDRTTLKIEMIINPNPSILNPYDWLIKGFKVTDDKGLVYTFNKEEKQRAQSISSPASMTGNAGEIYASGWLITKIEDPSNGDEITFLYTDKTSKKYESGFSLSDIHQISNANLKISYEGQTSQYSLIETWEPSLEKILFPDGSEMKLNYDFARLDYVNDDALTGIEIKNLKQDVVKKWQLSFSYFTNNYSGATYSSGNDYKKRLRLDNVAEVGRNNIDRLTTSFYYDNTPINRRDSYSQDYWGFCVDPNRPNTGLLAKCFPINLKIGKSEGQSYEIFGSDRSPDVVFYKAGLLQKISYPTGGHTLLEYENNSAFVPIHYMEDEVEMPSSSILSSDFYNNISLFFPNRTDEQVHFKLKAEEFGVRPPNNQAQTCPADFQDNQLLKFSVSSTDGIVLKEFEIRYAHLLNGVTISKDLPLNKAYQIKVMYDVSLQCNFQYPFKIISSNVFYKGKTNKLVGGARIKSITKDFTTGKKEVQNFYYNNDNGLSSAYLPIIPNASVYTSTTMGNPYCNYNIHRSSSPGTYLDFFKGSPIVYSKVTESKADNSKIERYYKPVYNESGSDFFPFVPVIQYPQLSGLLQKEIELDNNNLIKKEQIIDYNLRLRRSNDVRFFDNATILNRINIKVGEIANATDYTKKGYSTQMYFIHDAWAEDTLTTTKIFENGQILINTVKKIYDPITGYLKESIMKNSKGEWISENYFYANDFITSPYPQMKLANNISPIVKTFKKNISLNQQLSATINNYDIFPNSILPLPKNIEVAIGRNPVDTKVTFDKYDNRNNLLQYTEKNGIPTSIIWGYRNQYPVAKIIGKKYDDVINSSAYSTIDQTKLNDPASDSEIRNELNKLRTLLGNVLINSLSYNPLVGVSSETDANGKTLYYEYDNFNRLRLIRDKDNNIIKKICYNYQGQQSECSEIVNLPSACATCTGIDKKCINNQCETGIKNCIGSIRLNSTTWENSYVYKFSDGSSSSIFKVNETFPCNVIIQ